MKKLFYVLYAALWMLIAMGWGALAADAAPAATGLGQFVTDTLQPVLISVIGTLVPLLLTLLCRWISKKTGIAISDASQAKLESIAEKAVLYVEEKAAGSLKTAGEKWPSYVKHQQAVDMVLKLAPALTGDQADALVHWAVAKIPGLGATGVLGQTTTAPAASDTSTAPAADPAPVSAASSTADTIIGMLADFVAAKLPQPAAATTGGGADGGDSQLAGGPAAAGQ